MQLMAGNVATAEGAKALIERGVDWHQGGHRPRLHLHHARGHRVRRAADHGGLQLRGRGLQVRHPGHRRRRHPLLGRHGQGPRRGGAQRHDRLPVRGDHREPGRAHPLGRPQLQGLPGHGLGGRHERRQRGPLFPGRPEEAGARGHRGHGAPQGPLWPTWSTRWWAASGPAWATPAPPPSTSCTRGRGSSGSPRQAWRRATRTTCTITKEAPNYERRLPFS